MCVDILTNGTNIYAWCILYFYEGNSRFFPLLVASIIALTSPHTMSGWRNACTLERVEKKGFIPFDFLLFHNLKLLGVFSSIDVNIKNERRKIDHNMIERFRTWTFQISCHINANKTKKSCLHFDECKINIFWGK